MKAILRHLQTGLYLRSAETWTEKEEDALDFREIEPALEFAFRSGVMGLELNILLFDNPELTIRLALDQCCFRWRGLSHPNAIRCSGSTIPVEAQESVPPPGQRPEQRRFFPTTLTANRQWRAE